MKSMIRKALVLIDIQNDITKHYRALGCRFAEEINEGLAAAEPFDVQMEYRL